MRLGSFSSAAFVLASAQLAWAQTPPAGAPDAAETAPAPSAAAPVEPAPAAPPEPPASEQPVPAAPVAVAPPAEPKPEGPPKKLAVGKEGFWKPGIVAQVWAFATHSQHEWQQVSFRVRRMELKWTGEIVPERVGYTVVIDPARLLEASSTTVPVKDDAGMTIGTAKVSQPVGATSIVQDATVTLISDYADVSIGQFKIPVSYDAYSSVSKLLFPERSTVARRLGERRDIGLKAEKKFEHFGYVAAVMNGEGQNKLDSNRQKDLALRLEAYPIEGLTLAAVGYTSVGQRKLPNTKDRVEGDLRFEAGGLLVQGEYIRGTDRTSEDKRVTSHGYYGVVGYTIAKTLQPVARVGYFDPNVNQKKDDEAGWAKLDEQKEYSLGVTYLWQAHEAKFQLATSVFDYDQAPTEVTTILCSQVSF